MSNTKGNNKINSLATFFHYLKGKMNARDEHAFERDLLNDPFEADALDGFKSFEEDEIRNDLQAIRNKIPSPHTISNPFISKKSFAIAASIIVIMGLVSVLVFLQPDKPVLVSEQIEKEALSNKKSNQPAVKEIQEKEEHQPIIQPEEEIAEIIIEDSQVEYEFDKESETQKSNDQPIKADAKKASMTKAKKAELKPVSIEPQYKIASAQRRQQADSGNQQVVGTLKGAEFSGGGYGQLELVTIQGKVNDRYQHPVAGANVQVKGTKHATISKSDGSYELQFPLSDTSQPITASFIGYKPAEMIQNSQDSLNFTLDEQFFTLSEVQTISVDEEKIRQSEEYIPAEPEIGMDAYMDKLLEQMQYPENGTGKKETVVAIVTISDKGDVKDIEIKRSPDNVFSIETIRLIKEGPLWKPARQYGMPIQDEVKIKLQFIPNDEE
ncbi:carboxypeptidase-like regulatory domain-containing protein [Carboxylicivirga linearis]|uniref:Carboxypeptidase-like regulatory domain-containing protein n=1 Tax=Carboxylicivirga linearis TaxID=1628157 RepID=A0ABS5JSK0_9BACT|nr:carboxypeptidase-like regulatory domain-containing protein [Carboxylicivirga linearis]MBS2097870.1 carboxypeptidase-like regulatory domain-containing protein [Carboxylicivirga linearis]